MKTRIKAILFGAITLYGLSAQKVSDCDLPYTINKGDVIEIADPSASTYKYINLPRPNFLIKRGGIANFNRLKGQKIVITEVEITKDCKREIRIKRQDGKKFFNTLKKMSIDLEKAMETGEIKITKNIKHRKH